MHSLTVGTITANYNNANYLSDCLDGIRKQTYKPKYSIFVDDSSSDDSWNIYSTYLGISEQTSHIDKIIDGINYIGFRLLKNSGPAAARNVAVKYLSDKCDVVAIADSDDVYYPNKIKHSLEPFTKFPGVGLVYSDYDIHDMKTNEIKREFKEIFSLDRLNQECIVSNNSLISNKIFQIIGLYDETLRGPEDYDLWLRIAEVSLVYHLPESLYKYRITGNNITITTPSESFAYQVGVVKKKAMIRRGSNA